MRNDFEIRGDITAIFLHKKDGTILEAIIDTLDLPRADSFPMTWYSKQTTDKKSYYVAGNSPTINGKRKHIKFHRYLLGVEDDLVVDFINHDPLDCRRSKLRAVTQAENMQNLLRPYNCNTSGFRGVGWSKNHKKWGSYICINQKQIHLGYFDDLEQAQLSSLKARETMMPYSQEFMNAAR